ncbi:hypothetical protein NL676_008451 [Syzygium grande]|nr:hypothetical protein NL676_008451 [Syzygium grande]
MSNRGLNRSRRKLKHRFYNSAPIIRCRSDSTVEKKESHSIGHVSLGPRSPILSAPPAVLLPTTKERRPSLRLRLRPPLASDTDADDTSNSRGPPLPTSDIRRLPRARSASSHELRSLDSFTCFLSSLSELL